jgi:ubiquinone/menaquinone biosynthesis C-methylase UbiE
MGMEFSQVKSLKSKYMKLIKTHNEDGRKIWLKKTLLNLPSGLKILDAGAGELQNRKYCTHLNYVSQDFCQYHGATDNHLNEGMQNEKWDTNNIDIVSDITEIPEPNSSFDAILCSEVLEHVPEPSLALKEFYRLLRPGGKLILTAPFSSLVHQAPFHFCTGFSKYWYIHHLEKLGFTLVTLEPNGNWNLLLQQEIVRLATLERQTKNWAWPFSYLYLLLGLVYFKIRSKKVHENLGYFGWHCVAVKN